MRLARLFLLVILLQLSQVFAQEKVYEVHTVAFYNFENLFDTINDPNNDDEWTPEGKQRWTSPKYRQKLENLAKVLSQIGTNDKQKESPTFIGACEVENRGVLEDLIREPKLSRSNYGIVHFDSPDKRGIDVALLYRKNSFTLTSSINIPLHIYDVKRSDRTSVLNNGNEQEAVVGKRIYTRDILLVTGMLEGEEINLVVNHWPSRSGGEKKSSPFREAAGKRVRKIVDSLYKINPESKIICMGDYNDGPYNKSIKACLGAKCKKSEVRPFELYNPFEQLAIDGHATIFHRDSGDIFDQIILSEPLLRSDYSLWTYWKAGIYNKPFMIQSQGRFRGYPLRHSENEVGYSDHFPVYVYLIREAL